MYWSWNILRVEPMRKTRMSQHLIGMWVLSELLMVWVIDICFLISTLRLFLVQPKWIPKFIFSHLVFMFWHLSLCSGWELRGYWLTFVLTFTSFHKSTLLFAIMQGEGTLLAMGSYDGQARIWSRYGNINFFPILCSPVVEAWNILSYFSLWPAYFPKAV